MIKSIHLFAEAMCSAKIVTADGTEIEITLTREKLEGKSIDERYAAITARANALLACESPTNKGSFRHKILFDISCSYKGGVIEYTTFKDGPHVAITLYFNNVRDRNLAYDSIKEWEEDKKMFEQIHNTTINPRSPQV